MTKICIKNDCLFSGESQPLENFHKNKNGKYGVREVCGECCKKYNKQYRLTHETEMVKYRQENKQRQAEYNKIYKKENKNAIRQYQNQYQNQYQKERRKKDINFKILLNLRSRIYHILNGSIKKGSAIKDLGCSIAQLKDHFKSMFYSNPKTKEIMSWNNYGYYGWHIDHIIPLASFDLTDPAQFKKACHYTNLQPLWWFENFSKGKK